ncbi:MAG: tol-pal system protein YbgF [Deltaproteobacteria bacterium]|nr:tol-pal system protein YbgF [Deltaproteobacteria bacterium]
MVRMLKKILWSLAFSGLLVGCLPVQEQMRLEQDMGEVKRRLAFVERKVTSQSLDLKDETGRGVTALTKRQADVEANMDGLRVELQTLQGRLEEVVRENRQLRDELSLMRDDMALKTADLEERLSKPPAPAPAASTPVPAPAPAASSGEKAPDDLYKEGLALVLKTQKYGEAREVFQKFLKEYPDHHLAVNATYWIGEAYYGDKQYENAILQFQDVIQKFSKHPKAASAMYKQAFAFHAMGDVQNARVLLEKLIQTYPQSSEASRAKEKLPEWK